ncbi:MAG: Na/Pi cotransporter family protein [Lachnospiraceae bacterium]|nr:Na/Pi cotransporter family protein [Lachnospiraceae bacterium]
MDIFSVIMLLGGLAFFLYGMTIMSNGLKKMAGSKLETILKKMTSNRFKGLLLGAVVTSVIQSSSAVTVMLVGLVNSGIMQLGQTIGVIMGANIGTTITAWLLSLTGLEGSNIFVKLLKPSTFAPILALIGVLLIMAAKKEKKKDIGTILLGFAILMSGMESMSDAVEGLEQMPEFTQVLTFFDNPILGVIVGAVFTAIIQSSSASVGVLQALTSTGKITYGISIPIIMGQNIGTCITSVISSIGANKNAKRVTAVHISFNLIGTIICLSVFYIANAFLHFGFINDSIGPLGIAVCHSIFNVVTTVLLFPFCKQLEKLARLVIKDKEEKEEYTFLDERLLSTPSFAIPASKDEAENMARLAKKAIEDAVMLLEDYSQEAYEKIVELEEKLDVYEDKLGAYLVKLSAKELNRDDSDLISKFLHTISDFERIGDHALLIAKGAKEAAEKNMEFSAEARKEIKVLVQAVKDIIEITIDAFINDDVALADKVEPLEQVIDDLKAELKKRHVNRLQQGQCTIELGFILSDLLNNCGRVSDHCSNIAVCVIQIKEAAFETHGYLNEIKTSGEQSYVRRYERYKGRYTLPE